MYANFKQQYYVKSDLSQKKPYDRQQNQANNYGINLLNNSSRKQRENITDRLAKNLQSINNLNRSKIASKEKSLNKSMSESNFLNASTSMILNETTQRIKMEKETQNYEHKFVEKTKNKINRLEYLLRDIKQCHQACTKPINPSNRTFNKSYSNKGLFDKNPKDQSTKNQYANQFKRQLFEIKKYLQQFKQEKKIMLGKSKINRSFQREQINFSQHNNHSVKDNNYQFKKPKNTHLQDHNSQCSQNNLNMSACFRPTFSPSASPIYSQNKSKQKYLFKANNENIKQKKKMKKQIEIEPCFACGCTCLGRKQKN